MSCGYLSGRKPSNQKKINIEHKLFILPNKCFSHVNQLHVTFAGRDKLPPVQVCLTCLIPLLKLSMLVLATACCGSEFHSLTMDCVKEFFLLSILQFPTFSFTQSWTLHQSKSNTLLRPKSIVWTFAPRQPDREVYINEVSPPSH